MKPFDLEAAKRGEPIQTRDGRKAWFFGVAPDEIGDAQPVVAWCDGEGGPDSFTPEGRYFIAEESDNDLFMAPRKAHGYLIVWRDDDYLASAIFQSEAACNDHCDYLRDKGHTALTYGQKIEWEE